MHFSKDFSGHFSFFHKKYFLDLIFLENVLFIPITLEDGGYTVTDVRKFKLCISMLNLRGGEVCVARIGGRLLQVRVLWGLGGEGLIC